MNKPVVSQKPKKGDKDSFLQIYQLISEAKDRTWQQINHSLINLYWNVGTYVHEKVKKEDWGKGVVEELSHFIQLRDPAVKGFSGRNIWRMKQFFETYSEFPKLSALLTEISWSNHLHILSKTKTIEEKEFYLTLASKNRYPERDFARIIDSSTYERTAIADKKLSAVLSEFPLEIKGIFKDKYIFEFLNLPDGHEESDLRKLLIKHLKKFLLELGPDFTLIGEEYTIQVGMKDFKIDILMFHRGLNCLVALELKVTDFKPEHLGQLQFYLEALDKNIKKENENPSIGILICKTKDEEVVQYAMNRNISPAMVSEYETKLFRKDLLQKKLHEILSVNYDNENNNE